MGWRKPASRASFRASGPEETLAAFSPPPALSEPSAESPKEHPQHPCRDRRADHSLHPSISSCGWSFLVIPVSTEAAGGRAGMGAGCSPRASNHQGTSTCKTTTVIIHQQFTVLKFSAVVITNPQTHWPLSGSSSGGEAEPHGRFAASASTSARPSARFAVRLNYPQINLREIAL